MNGILEALNYHYNTVVYETNYFEFLVQHKSLIINSSVAVLAFYFGKWKARSNQFERYINSFINSTKTEAGLISKQNLYARLRNYKRYITLVIILICISISTYLNYSVVFDKTMILTQKFNHIKQDNINAVIILLVLTTLTVSHISSRYIKYTQLKISSRLDSIRTNKSLYVEKFFDLIGPEMMREIRKFLVKGSEKEEAKHRDLENRYSDVQMRFKKTSEKCVNEHRKFQAYKQFADEIMRFEWCEICYCIENRSDYIKNESQRVKALDSDDPPVEERQRVASLKPSKSVGDHSQGHDTDKPGVIANQNGEIEAEEVKSKFGIEHATQLNNDTEFKVIDDVSSVISKSHQDVATAPRCVSYCLERFLSLCEDIGNKLADNLKKVDLS